MVFRQCCISHTVKLWTIHLQRPSRSPHGFRWQRPDGIAAEHCTHDVAREGFHTQRDEAKVGGPFLVGSRIAMVVEMVQGDHELKGTGADGVGVERQLTLDPG